MTLSRRKFIGSSAAAAAFTMVPVSGLEGSTRQDYLQHLHLTQISEVYR